MVHNDYNRKGPKGMLEVKGLVINFAKVIPFSVVLNNMTVKYSLLGTDKPAGDGHNGTQSHLRYPPYPPLLLMKERPRCGHYERLLHP